MATAPPETVQTIFVKQGDDGNTSKPAMMLVLPEDQKPFRCGLCSISFHVNKDLVIHVQAHFVHKPYQCGFCSVSYESNPDLLSHVKTHKLFFCLSQFSDSAEKRAEDDCAVNDGDDDDCTGGDNDECFDDDKCSQADDQLKEYDAHSSVHDASVSVKEEIQENQDHPGEVAARELQSLCPTRNSHHLTGNQAETYDSTDLFVNSINENSKDTNQSNCPTISDRQSKDQCPKHGNDSQQSDTSKGETHSPDITEQEWPTIPSQAEISCMFRCGECDAHFPSATTLGHHWEICHKACNVCNESFPYPQSLQDHIQSAHGEYQDKGLKRPFLCGLCGAGFWVGRYLHIHIARVHKINASNHKNTVLPIKDQMVQNAAKDSLHHSGSVGENKAPVSSSTGRLDISNLFDCPVCPQQNESQAQLKAHMHSMHIADGRFQCPVCKKTLKDIRGLKWHYKICHEKADVRPHQCQECGKKFKMQHHLKDHLQAVHGVEQVRPSGTVSDNSTPASSTVGVSECNKTKVFDCPVCPQQNESRVQLKDHLHSMHSADGRFLCPLCKKTFKEPHGLKWHYKRCHVEADVRPHQCQECGKRFKIRRHLSDHMQALHVQGETRVRPSCPQCQKTFKDERGLKWHTKVCHEEADIRPHQCQECGKKFRVSHHLKDHIKSVHEKVAVRSKVICHICGKAVLGLTVHIASVHSDARPHKCTFCDKSFKLKIMLTSHLKTHTKEKPFVCEICGKSFARKLTLASHRNTHTNAKPYICDICHKGFNAMPGLRKHRHLHTGYKPYACAICGMKFISSTNFQRHAVTHTDQRPLSCDKCGKTYRHRGNLRYHKTHSHNMN